MSKISYKVEGMTCDHCVMHVTEALESVEGVESAKVSLKKGEAKVKAEDSVQKESLQKAVEEAGYKLL